MTLPTPDDPARAPIWDNYVVAQAVQASLARLPPHALAFGVAVNRSDVRLVFQLSEVTEQDAHDMNELQENFEALVGDAISVTLTHEVRQARNADPHDGIRWVFLARAASDYDD
jgi:hypothetical protein